MRQVFPRSSQACQSDTAACIPQLWKQCLHNKQITCTCTASQFRLRHPCRTLWFFCYRNLANLIRCFAPKGSNPKKLCLACFPSAGQIFLKKMGKGGYGKGWQNRRWQSAHQQWHSSHHDRASWHSQYRQPQRESSLTHLCAGVVTSAFEGVCSGVASATWAAVQGAANTLMNGRSATQGQMQESSSGPADIMKCLAGSGTNPDQQAHPPRETAPTPSANKNQSVAEQMVLNLQEQQLLLQKQLVALQEKQQAAEVAAAATAVTNAEGKPCQKVPAQPTDEDPDTPGSTPPQSKTPKPKHAAKPKAKSKLAVKSKATKGKKPKAE